MPLPPAQVRWAILVGIPKVAKDKDAKLTFPPDADVSVARDEPPRASVLTVPLRVSSPPCLRSYPNVAAADPSGLLLLRATEPDGDGASSPVVTYHLCDARTGEAACLRERDRPVGFRGGNSVGLMVRGGSCVVAELHPAGDGTGRATLLRYTVGEYKWLVNELAYSPPLRRDWCGEGVVSHSGMLWWADLSYGLLACDPFADKPELRHVPLPTVLDQLPAVDSANSGARRCVRVSGGRLRYVQIHGDAGAPVVSTWALTEAGEWNPERRVPMADVWPDESYVDAMLPGSIPALALLHPQDPDKLYFFLGPCIFAVDLRRRKVLESSQFGMPDPPNKLIVRSSHFVHAWQYDPSSSRSVLLLTCLTQEKEIAAQCRGAGNGGRALGLRHRVGIHAQDVWAIRSSRGARTRAVGGVGGCDVRKLEGRRGGGQQRRIEYERGGLAERPSHPRWRRSKAELGDRRWSAAGVKVMDARGLKSGELGKSG
ncbi:hypothetical protein C2845_PM06G32210 [Panicum miliaceum]|uniref:DUF1618 domain-containing protein n=1 Tax=Panicum miliaceum TaxID=4540 RepID=A0A3L6RE48_PANMI|nr:hypothetical protein C2845_PM06G32210 [Panicum miliaceum]